MHNAEPEETPFAQTTVFVVSAQAMKDIAEIKELLKSGFTVQPQPPVAEEGDNPWLAPKRFCKKYDMSPSTMQRKYKAGLLEVEYSFGPRSPRYRKKAGCDLTGES